MIEIFKEIAKIPRPSGHEEKIAEYLCDFAKKRSLKYRKDEYLNVIIWHPGSPGRETEAPVILQAHTDMVCEKNSDIEKDFLTEGIDVIIEGDTMQASGTTLGADDGAGVAMILKLLNDDSISKPPLECVFTSCEEEGLVGAANIDLSDLKGKMLLNLDSEEEGYFTVGCAGGGNVKPRFTALRSPAEGVALKISVDGLYGGHSGVNINDNRGNANIILANVLGELSNVLRGNPAKPLEYRIVSIEGGTRDNAIPRAASAVIVVSEEVKTEINNRLPLVASIIKEKYKGTEDKLTIDLTNVNIPKVAFSITDSHRLVKLIKDLPNGVVRMEEALPDMVETSLNLGVVKTVEDTVFMTYHIRSSNKKQFELLKASMISTMDIAKVPFEIDGEYPAWEMVKDSPLRDRLVNLHRDMYGKEPVVMVIHAGLECGVLGKKIPDLDAVSLGPDLRNVHSPREEMSISSANRVMEFLIRFLDKQ